MGKAVDGLIFKAVFLDAAGFPIEIVSLPASTLTIAAQLAGEMATEIAAADFFITARHPPPPPRRFTHRSSLH